MTPPFKQVKNVHVREANTKENIVMKHFMIVVIVFSGLYLTLPLPFITSIIMLTILIMLIMIIIRIAVDFDPWLTSAVIGYFFNRFFLFRSARTS